MLSVHSCPLGKVGGENTGGMSVYIRELGRELGRRGHLVDVYTRIHEPIHDQVVELGKNARLIHFRAGEEETQQVGTLFSSRRFHPRPRKFQEGEWASV